MDFLNIFLCVVLGFLLLGIWFGSCFAIGILLQKTKASWLSYLNTTLASIIPVFLIAITMGIYSIQPSGLRDIKVYIVAVFTVLITAAIVTLKKPKERKSRKALFLWGLDGMLMEIPQRLMMQSFIYGILQGFGILSLNLYTILATAFIWCLGIGMQMLLSKKSFDKGLMIDIAASFAFSLGIGYVYQRTGLIALTMLAHFGERVLSCYISNKRYG